MKDTNSLTIFTKAAAMLADADTIQKAKELKSLSLTAADWAKRKGMGEEAIAYCRSYALEAERKMGEILLQTERAKGTAGQGRPRKGSNRTLPPNPDKPYVRSELALKLEDVFAEKAKGNQRLGGGGGKAGCQKSDKVLTRADTKRELARLAKTAKAAKVSERKLKKARAVRKKSPRLAAKVEAGAMTLDAAMKELRAAEIAEQRAKVANASASIKPSDRWTVHHADMQTWKTKKRFDWIITDPPYPKEFLPLYESLAMRSNEWLKDGGLLVAMCGQSYLKHNAVAGGA